MLDALKLVNAPKDFEFAGTKYQVKNANLEKIILFQAKFAELSAVKDPSVQPKIAAYCLYLILKDATPAIPDVSEAWVAQNATEVDMPDVLEEFAFMNRQKVELLRKVLGNSPAPKTQTLPTSEKETIQTGESSST